MNANSEIYSSSDGVNWELETSTPEFGNRAYFGLIKYNSKLVLVGGQSTSDLSSVCDDVWTSEDGKIWNAAKSGLDGLKYYSLAATYVRREDALEKKEDIPLKPWSKNAFFPIVGVDEVLKSGTISLKNNGLVTGTNTKFLEELNVGDYIRINGDYNKYEITYISKSNEMEVNNEHEITYTDVSFSKLPNIGQPVTTDVFAEGSLEGGEEVDNREIVYTDTDKTRLYIDMSLRDEKYNRLMNKGVTHVRLYRTLQGDSKEIVKGLSHRFVADIAIAGYYQTGSSDNWHRVYVDNKNDRWLSGVTNFLYTTDFSTPPNGKFAIWTNNLLWIGGVEDNPGRWFFSALPDYYYNIKCPQKYASLFNTVTSWKDCDPNDGQRDMGCAVLEGDLYLFKESKIFVINNSDPNNNPIKISNYIGCMYPYSIINAEPSDSGKMILFLTNKGPAVISPGGKIELLEDFTIKELWPEGTLEE